MLINVESAVEALGIDYEVKGHEASAVCPMHLQRVGRVDHSPSWWINLETGKHICFSCHYKGSLLGLIADIKGFRKTTWGIPDTPDYDAAKVWLSTISDVTPEMLTEMLESHQMRIGSLPKPFPMSESRLAIFVDPPQEALLSRDITAESAKAYGLLWEEATSRWIIPLRYPNGLLMGWQEKGTVDRYFKNRPAGIPMSKTFFGLNRIQIDLPVYVVESPLDAVKLHALGYEGAVAICGSSISDEQVKLLRPASRVYSALDNPAIDAAGKKGSYRLMEATRKYGIPLSLFNYGDTGKKDIGDMTAEQVEWGVEHTVSSLLGDAAILPIIG